MPARVSTVTSPSKTVASALGLRPLTQVSTHCRPYPKSLSRVIQSRLMAMQPCSSMTPSTRPSACTASQLSLSGVSQQRPQLPLRTRSQASHKTPLLYATRTTGLITVFSRLSTAGMALLRHPCLRAIALQQSAMWLTDSSQSFLWATLQSVLGYLPLRSRGMQQQPQHRQQLPQGTQGQQ